MNVALYLRKSRETEGENESREETLARHEKLLRDYCDKHHLFFKEEDIYREVVSGESLSARPQMLSLLKKVSEGQYDGVVCIELERLSRGSGADQEYIKNIFKSTNTLIYTLNKTYDLANEEALDEDFFEFGLFMSRREYQVIKKRLQRGKKQARNEGYFISAVLPFGFTKVKDGKGYILVPDEKEAPIVKTMFEMYADIEHNQIASIKDYLIMNGIKTRTGKSNWTTKRIRMMLRNKVYIGYLCSNYVNGEPTQWNKGKHKPLIDMQLWEEVQNRLDAKMTHTVRNKGLVNPLASILKCSFCGSTMRLNMSDALDANKRVQCPNRGCKNVMATIYDVEKILLAELKAELKDFNYFIHNEEDEMIKRKNQNQAEIDAVKESIKRKNTAIDRCCEAYEEGIYTKEKYFNRVNVLEAELQALEGRLKELHTVKFDEVDNVKRQIPILEKVISKYWELDAVAKNDILKSLIEKIEYTKTEKKRSKFTDNAELVDLKIYMKI